MGKILVTGAAGFLGGRTAKHFAGLNAGSVIASSRRAGRANELEESGCTFVPGDLTDPKFCDFVTKDVQTIIHCAALSSPFGPYEQFYQANYVATKQLLDAGKKNGVGKFIFISTPSIYFNYNDRFGVKEDDPLPQKMVNAYAATKLLAEQYVLEHHSHDIHTIALRPRAIIGAEDTVIFPRVLEAYHRGRLKIVGSGNNVCDMTCVSNVILAIKCALKAGEANYGEAYNITDGNPVDFWQAVNYALKALDLEPVEQSVPGFLANAAAFVFEKKAMILKEKKEPVLTRYGVGILSQNFTLDITKAVTRLQYQPQMNTFEGINEYISWHLRQA